MASVAERPIVQAVSDDSVGSVYLIKTGTDPRRDCGLYAKLKILDFNVIDAANHEVEMVFLWTVNRSCQADLQTANVDTFDLTVVTRREGRGEAMRRHGGGLMRRQGEAARLRFAVSGSGVRVVGAEMVGKAERVWDLRGRARVFTRRAE